MQEKQNGHWLISDFDHREPKDDLHNVDDGKYLQALQNLPDSIRLLLQDGDMRVEVDEVDGIPIVTKIVKKREAAYLQSTEHYFIYDNEGKRIPLTEEDFHKLVGLKEDPEDVLNMDEVDLQSINSEHVAPMDVWDVIYDSTEFTRAVPRLLENQKFQLKPIEQKLAIIKKLQDDLIYSADYFPYPVDKRFHSEAAAKVAKLIFDKDLSKQQLGALLGPRSPETRGEYVKELRAKASKLPPGKVKADTLLKAQRIFDQLMKDRKAGKTREHSVFTDSDRAKLWALWRAKEAKTKGKVQLLDWQFRKLYGAKLQKQILMPELERIDQLYNDGKVTRDEAKIMRAQCRDLVNDKLKERMQALYGKSRVKPIEIERTKAPILAIEVPSWLENIPPQTDELVDSDCQTTFVPPEPSTVLDESYFMDCEVDQEEYFEESLLENE